MPFEWIKENSVPHITISKTGIALDKAALETFSGAERIIIGINKEDEEIAFKAHFGEQGVESFEIGEHKIKQGWLRINNKDVLRYINMTFKLSPEIPYRYVPETRDGMLIVRIRNNIKK
ncbi:MAG: hypothetical protein SOR92_08110 [Christensenella hongkongensis]|uniref:hypothetical protein n=1 Tax=Christensenella hongkongensis TaxID=270498 RepID=UPI00267385EF|nr:hypothetical protein [Christensenella hongkongensis]MDY3004420.1 hypothetical protein [Christensenella hongkongensis]